MAPPLYHRASPLSAEAYQDLLKVLEGQQVIFPKRLVDTILLELGLYPVEDTGEIIVYDPHCMTRRLHGQHSFALHEKYTYCEMGNMISAVKQPFNGEGKECGNLCQDILESILGWLCPAEYLKCGAVCSWWRAIVGDHRKPALQLPLLMLNFRVNYDKLPPCIFSLNKQKLQYPNKPLYSATQKYIGSIDGWLIMMDMDSVNDFWDIDYDNHNSSCLSDFYYFLNPVSSDRVLVSGYLSLPDNIKEEDRLPLFYKMVASSIPVGQDCFVAGLSETLSETYLAYGNLDNKPWALIEDQSKCFKDIQIHDGKLYVVKSKPITLSIMVCDLRLDKDCTNPKAQILVVHEVQHFLNLPQVRLRRVGNIVHVIDNQEFQLAKDVISGELFLVVVISDYDFPLGDFRQTFDPPRPKRFAVFKLEIGGGGGGFRLVVMDTLGDRLIFLGVHGGGGVVIPATSLGISQRFLKRNCIYFPNWNCCSRDQSQLGIEKFSLDDKSIECLNPESDLIPVCHLHSVCWFIPKL